MVPERQVAEIQVQGIVQKLNSCNLTKLLPPIVQIWTRKWNSPIMTNDNNQRLIDKIYFKILCSNKLSFHLPRKATIHEQIPKKR